MKIHDCDAAYGRGTCALPREIETAAELAAELEYRGIAEALVWHRDAQDRGIEWVERRLPELADFPQLHPTLTMVPTCCDEMPSAENFIERMRACGARAVRAFRVRHAFLLDRVSCGDLFDAFIAHSVPVIVPLPELPGMWHNVYDLLRDFPRLTLVVTQSGCWGEDRFFRPLMREYPRFFISTNRFETAGQLKSLVDSVGPDHLLFGSGLPFNEPGGYVMMLARAEIPDEARSAIAWGNLDRLLGEVPW